MAFDAFKKLSGASSLFNQSLSPIAVDFGVGSLKILQIVNGDPPTLVAAATIETPLELRSNHAKRLDFQLEAFPRLVRNAGFRGKRAVCAIPASHTFCRHMQVPRTEGLSVGDQAAAQLAQQLQCDPDALVYRHAEVGPAATPGHTEVVCLAAPRELVKRLLTTMKESRLEPVGMHSEFSASLRAFDYRNRRSEDSDKTTLYLDIGAGATKLILAHGPHMVFARKIEIGGAQLDELIEKQLKVDCAESHRVRLAMRSLVDGAHTVQKADASGGTVVEAGPQADLSEPVETLIDEVRLSLRAREAAMPGRRLERAVFLGGEARSKALCQHIAKALRVPAQLADPLARLARQGNEPLTGIDLREPQPGWAVALGLCVSPTDL